MTETLRIDTGLVLEAGGRLQTLAGAIPPPPATFRPAGADALSTAIAGRVAEVVDPVIAQLPVTKEELTRFAQNVVNAADQVRRDRPSAGRGDPQAFRGVRQGPAGAGRRMAARLAAARHRRDGSAAGTAASPRRTQRSRPDRWAR